MLAGGQGDDAAQHAVRPPDLCQEAGYTPEPYQHPPETRHCIHIDLETSSGMPFVSVNAVLLPHLESNVGLNAHYSGIFSCLPRLDSVFVVLFAQTSSKSGRHAQQAGQCASAGIRISVKHSAWRRDPGAGKPAPAMGG